MGACLGEGDAQVVYAEMAQGDRLSYVKEKRGREKREASSWREGERRGTTVKERVFVRVVCWRHLF